MTVSSADLLAYASKYLGVPYQFGAAGPDRFDCSGFTQYVFHHYGINLPHHAADQAKLGTGVDKTKIQAGDLVFSDWGDGPNSHVGIATGRGTIIDAPHTGAVVRYDKLGDSYLKHVTAVRRMAGVDGATGDTTTEYPIPSPGGPTGTTSGSSLGGFLDPFIGPVQELGRFATSSTRVADGLFRLWAPTSIVRGMAGVLGLVFIILGIWMLSREVRK